jgi:ABC-type cobalamin/Fe3+-siderophores transport system ATPase subunit
MNEGEIVAIGKPEEVLDPELLTDTFGIAVDVNLAHNPPIVFPS